MCVCVCVCEKRMVCGCSLYRIGMILAFRQKPYQIVTYSCTMHNKLSKKRNPNPYGGGGEGRGGAQAFTLTPIP